MTEPQPANPSAPDNSQIVKSRSSTSAWVWLFPILALVTTGWFFWNNWKSLGPEIEIVFDSAPGMQAGKTVLVYRGVTSGTVTNVRLHDDLKSVVVTVRLKAFADGIARSETDFWIDQPVISLTQTSGLEALIQGNSIQARVRGGEPASRFVGRTKPPLDGLEAPALMISLQATSIPLIDRGTPVYHRGIVVGAVREKSLTNDGLPTIEVHFTKQTAGLVRKNSRFWILPATSLKLGPGGASLDVAGLQALIQGGIAFDHFGAEGEPAPNGTVFALDSTETLARADGPLLTVSLDDARGLISGTTRVCFLGQPVGLVEAVKINPTNRSVDALVRLESAFSDLARASAVFTLVRPRISLEGVTGLDTIVTGAYLAVEPGNATELASNFFGRSVSNEEWDKASANQAGVPIKLTATNIPSISKGAPIFYRGLVAGSVLEKTLDEHARPVLRAVVHREYANALRANSRFWRVPATAVSIGPGVVKVETQGVEALLQGGIAFDTFDKPAAPAPAASAFELFDNEALAAATSGPIRITFETARGLVAGRSELRYLGLPVGQISALRSTGGKIEVTAYMRPGYEFLQKSGSTFAIVEPKISLKGVTGIETIVSGVYIECLPGSGSETASSFVGVKTSDPVAAGLQGFAIRISAPATTIVAGAKVTYRDLSVGQVTAKVLSEDGQSVILTVVIDPKYRRLVHENSRFWDASAIEASIGFIKLKLHSQTLIDPNGRIAFANPPQPGNLAPEGHVFQLNPNSQRRLQSR